MLMKAILFYKSVQGGVEWTITNYVDEDNPNDAQGAADTWNTAHLRILSHNVTLQGMKVIVNPLPAPAIKVEVHYAADTFTDDTGAQMHDHPTSSLYMMARGSGSLAGGSSFWKIHGLSDSYMSADGTFWAIAGDINTFNAACLVWLNQYRRLATTPNPDHPKRRSYPVVSPPRPWPVFECLPDVFETKTGRSFSLPGLQRR